MTKIKSISIEKNHLDTFTINEYGIWNIPILGHDPRMLNFTQNKTKRNMIFLSLFFWFI